MMKPTRYLVAALIFFSAFLAVLFLGGCAKTCLEPVEQLPIEEMFKGRQ